MRPAHRPMQIPLGLIWITAHETARIRALARTARNLTGTTT